MLIYEVMTKVIDHNFGSNMLWQPLITKTNDHTSSKSLKLDIKWEVHKRT